MMDATANTQSNTEDILRDLLGIVDSNLLKEDKYTRYVESEDCIVLVHVHLLPSTVALFERLIALGFRSDSIIIIPKIYSTIQEAEQSIRNLGCIVVKPDLERFQPGYYDHFAVKTLEKGVKIAVSVYRINRARRCILVDDGGILTDTWSRYVCNTNEFSAISVQQTASGLYRQRLNFKVRRINVATSAAKIHFESHIIVSGILRKVTKLHLIKRVPSRVGIIGMGTLGRKLADLLRNNHHLFAYDIRGDKGIIGINHERDWQSCVNKADIIFGCTGKNFMHFAESDIFDIQQSKSFVSLSSRDVEFKSLLLTDKRLWSRYNLPTGRGVVNTTRKHIQPGAFDNIEIKTHKGVSLIVYNGGFPINFDRTYEWETESDISLTRGLVLLAIMQSLCVPPTHDPNSIDKLALNSQRRLVEVWLNRKKQTSEEFGVSLDDFHNQLWWRRACKEPR